jgi:hypothetical protein
MMAKYSMKIKGKEIGPAEVYAPPHTMDGKPTNVATYTKTESGAEGNGQTKHVLWLLQQGQLPSGQSLWNWCHAGLWRCYQGSQDQRENGVNRDIQRTV